jgi:hypothetical protein
MWGFLIGLSGDDPLSALSEMATTPPRQKKPGENEKAFCLAPAVGRPEGSIERRLNPSPSTVLDHLDGWQRVYSDETAVVHIRTAETAHRAN